VREGEAEAKRGGRQRERVERRLAVSACPMTSAHHSATQMLLPSEARRLVEESTSFGSLDAEPTEPALEEGVAPGGRCMARGRRSSPRRQSCRSWS